MVDDDPSTLKALKRMLTAYGFQAVLFNSAEDIRRRGDFEQAFCIVLDIDLGAESGITLHQELHAAGIDLPVIYMSGREPERRTVTLASGCVAFLIKPFAARSLIDPIQRISACLNDPPQHPRADPDV